MAPGYREPHDAVARKGVVMTVTADRRHLVQARDDDATAQQDPDLRLTGPVSPVTVGEGEPGGDGVLVAADPGGKELQFRLVVGFHRC
jgi:hypothetical protein